mmetsp:Transcript_19133/g.76207  ORF Transcript_19133/g.76207 Transcript_19133/m.76207 type:complete len:255 (-) Transcript_19133:894-1658(-)
MPDSSTRTPSTRATGGSVSVDGVGRTNSPSKAVSTAGMASPASASTLTVSCRTSRHAPRGSRATRMAYLFARCGSLTSCMSSRPHDHWTVAAPKVSAPLATSRCATSECVAVPESNVAPQSWIACTLSTVVSESFWRYAGCQPLSTGASHSCPRRPWYMATCRGFAGEEAEVASSRESSTALARTDVCAQSRCAPKRCASTTRASLRCAFAANMVPESAFSGLDPLGLTGRASRNVPVHASVLGSSLSTDCVSL